MKIVLLKTLMLVTVIIACGITALAQPSNDQKQIPEGKWVLELESIYAFKANCKHNTSEEHIHAYVSNEVSIDSIDIKLYTELQVKQNTIELISLKSKIQGKYTYDDLSGICFDSSAVPFLPGGNVIANKLYIQQKVVNPLDESDSIYVSLVYEHKN